MDHAVIAIVALLVPIIAIICGPIVVHLGLQAAKEKREILSRERLAAMEKGIEVPFLDTPEPDGKRQNPLRGALVTIGAGVGLMVFFFSVSPGEHNPWGIGLMIALVGFAMLAHWFLGGKREWERQLALDEELKQAYIDRLRGGRPAAARTESAREQ